MFNNRFAKSPVRVPVKFVQGQWEYFFGGGVPVREGTVADLVIEKQSITDSSFLGALSRRTEHRMLGQGITLRVALTIRQGVGEVLQGLLIKVPAAELSEEFFSTPRPSETRFVEIEVGPPAPKSAQRRRDTEGGVWLRLEGAVPKGIVSSSIIVPQAVSKDSLDSLNHAFTRLSEVFEPWRTSHTGNVYTRILYQESDQKWYPLDRLRRAAEAKEERSIMRDRWDEIAAMLAIGGRE